MGSTVTGDRVFITAASGTDVTAWGVRGLCRCWNKNNGNDFGGPVSHAGYECHKSGRHRSRDLSAGDKSIGEKIGGLKWEQICRCEVVQVGSTGCWKVRVSLLGV